MISSQFPIRGIEMHVACITYTKSRRTSLGELGNEACVTGFEVMS